MMVTSSTPPRIKLDTNNESIDESSKVVHFTGVDEVNYFDAPHNKLTKNSNIDTTKQHIQCKDLGKSSQARQSSIRSESTNIEPCRETKENSNCDSRLHSSTSVDANHINDETKEGSMDRLVEPTWGGSNELEINVVSLLMDHLSKVIG
eukprot:10561051-Ditylum_brightwellii.AAC.1